MATKTPGERLDRLEQVVHILAEDQITAEKELSDLRKIVADFAVQTRRAFDQVAAQFAESERRMRETDRRIAAERAEMDKRLAAQSAKTDRRTQQLDERIDKLVIAIGELIQRDRNGKKT